MRTRTGNGKDGFGSIPKGTCSSLKRIEVPSDGRSLSGPLHLNMVHRETPCLRSGSD